MRPFLLLATRADDIPADDEYQGFLRATGLAPTELTRVRLEAAPMPAIDLDDFSGVFIGGSPFTASDPIAEQSMVQRRVQAEISTLLDEVVARDHPFLGACFGIGSLGAHQGGVIDREFGEPIGRVTVTPTSDGLDDPLLAGLGDAFDAFVGHKEACSVLPASATLLASSAHCPVQMFRVRENVYATQFHPELDVPGIVTRIRAYRDEGYFDPQTMDALIRTVSEVPVTAPGRVLANFVERYAR